MNGYLLQNSAYRPAQVIILGYFMYKSKITGMGFKVPDNIISNDDLSKIMDTSDEWIQTRSGIKERRWATEEVTTSDLALSAANNAIKNAEINNKEIDLNAI